MVSQFVDTKERELILRDKAGEETVIKDNVILAIINKETGLISILIDDELTDLDLMVFKSTFEDILGGGQVNASIQH